MKYQIWNQDCISGMAEKLAENSIDLCVTSIPFGSLFMYSGKPSDIGNNHDGIDMEATQFGLHMRFFIEQLFRVMKPGTNACIHIQQLLTTKVQHGYMGRRDFRGAVVEQFSKGGFEWKGEFVINKNPQIIAQRQKLHSLLFATGARNARDLAPAVCDYVMIFQKPGEAVPVRALKIKKYPKSFLGADTGIQPLGPIEGNQNGWVTTEEWIRDAHGVWTDIRETDVLEGWDEVKEEGDEKHVCPLQLEVIRRLVNLYSNPGEVVLDPFMGIGSTGWVALGGATRAGLVVKEPRQVRGFELKESYWKQAVRNCETASKAQVTESPELPLFAEVNNV